MVVYHRLGVFFVLAYHLSQFPATGVLVSIRNLDSRNEYLQEEATSGNPFALYYDFSGMLDITTSGGGTLRVAIDPQAITRSVFSPRHATRISFRIRESTSSNRPTVTYNGELWRAEVAFSLTAGSTTDGCELSLTNMGTIPAVCMCIFPFVSGHRLSKGRRYMMTALNEAGYIRPLLCDHEDGIYGNGGQMSMQWRCAIPATGLLPRGKGSGKRRINRGSDSPRARATLALWR